ncbi:MAG: RagB/SusD family nutrient uptake outer membrane protein [Bacteroidaceae bacterium]|nr:RagB/SusD family nutrient uptake outer membrane protein [Bacteroidaceae bacterium]MBR1801510.1 RagB/SusD family nutrient uptake outer membrane protein [Bacteroidaceae bacterium]
MLLPLGGGWVGLSSCSFIDEDLEGQTTNAVVGDSDEAVQTWVTGVYSKWVYDMFCWGYFPKVLELDADYISGPTWLFKAFGVGNFEGEAEICDALWKGCYGLIERANYAEEQILAMQHADAAVKANALGELNFHRAMAYFLLVRAYGPVPLCKRGVDPLNNPRVGVDQVYAEIFTLLERATTQLYKNTDSRFEPGHVSAGSAAGLLAKAYATAASSALGAADTYVMVRTGRPYNVSGGAYSYARPYAHKMKVQAVSGYENIDIDDCYTKAAEWASKVVKTDELGVYGNGGELCAYDQLWGLSNRYDSEFLFSVYVPNGDPKYKTSIHTNYEGIFTTASCELKADGGWIGCTYNWYQLFDASDRRIIDGVRHRLRTEGHAKPDADGIQGGLYYPADATYKALAENHLPPFDQEGVKYWSFGGTPDDQLLAFTTKYMDVTDPTTGNADSPWPFLRLADIYLIYAEAENELDNATEALAYLQKVQARSEAPLRTLAELRTLLDEGSELTDKELLRSAILEERAKELACEGDRRWDLIRWGIYLSAMNAIEGNDDAGVSKSRLSRNLLFPLPAQEMNTNKAITENNPGWK